MTYKLAVFDMDGTLLRGRTIFTVATEKGFMKELLKIMGANKPPYQKTIDVAMLLHGTTVDEFLGIFGHIPLQKNAEVVVHTLKRHGLKTAIITDSYDLNANYLKNRLGIDYAFANTLVTEKNQLTGEVILHNKNHEKREDMCHMHSICKKEVLLELCSSLTITPDEAIAVGDGEIDRCMLEAAGLGLAFNAPESVQQSADANIFDLIEILKYVGVGSNYGHQTGGSNNPS